MRRYLPFALVAMVGLGALGGGTLLYRAKKPPTPALTPTQLALARQCTDSAHVRGDPGASVTVEEFADLECPPCGALCDPLNQLLKDFPGRVRLIFRQFPLATHAHAQQAALATEAAGLQGRFWEMHDLIYREQNSWSREADAGPLFAAFAGTLGLDLARFEKDRQGGTAKARVSDDERRGVKLGVSTTPTIFINGREVSRDSLRPDRLRALVELVVRSTPAH